MVVKNSKLKIQVIHGPNLNLLGSRETDIYGSTNLTTINKKLTEIAKEYKVDIEFFQSNHEGEIVDTIHNNRDADGFLINPAAFTHTSIALRDAFLGIKKPIVEVHLSNVFKREEFRHKSFISDIAVGVMSGFGEDSYYLGLQALINHLKGK